MGHTLFADETVIPVIRVVCIPRNSTASVAYDSEVELCRDMAVSYPRGERAEQETKGKAQLHTQELMAEAARVARVVPNVEGLVGGRHGEMKSEQSIPERAWMSQASPSNSRHPLQRWIQVTAAGKRRPGLWGGGGPSPSGGN